MYLFFDTETTGLPRNWNAPVTDLNNWPRMVQLAWLLYDEAGDRLEAFSAIITPQGFTIPADAARVHGITTERALREGVDLAGALRQFAEAIDRSSLVVAHNMNFDKMIVGAEFLRTGVANRLPTMPTFCTMTSTTEFVGIPGRYGFKWPTLSELHQRLFGQSFVGAHSADTDVLACATCFFELKRRGVIAPPGGKQG